MKPMPPQHEDHEEDLKLAQQVIANDPIAVEIFVKRMRCVGSILKIRNARYGRPLDRAALEDLVQDVLVVIWRKLSTYEGRGPLEAWVYRIAAFQLMSALRAARRLPRTCGDLDLDHASPDPTPEPVEPSKSLGHRLIRHLAGREAEIVKLRHLEGLKFDEIAELLEVAPSTAKTHYYRAVEKLRTILAPLAGEMSL